MANLRPMSDNDCRMMGADDDDAVTRTVEVLGNDGIVALPTETVYGLGGSIASNRAIDRIYAVKGRPRSHPLILHIADVSELHGYVEELSGDALTCANACWPGPFTMLVRRNDHVPDHVVGGSEHVALRIPANHFTRKVIRGLGSPVAAPSANLFGRVSPTTALHVCRDLGTQVDLIVDGGPCSIGVESTIIDFTGDRARLVRPGGLPVEDIGRVLGYEIESSPGLVKAPGTLPVHYQPQARVIVAENDGDADRVVEEHRRAGRHVVRLVHADSAPLLASTLYAQLRQADDAGADLIVAKLPSTAGLGLAIRDRLMRAAAH